MLLMSCLTTTRRTSFSPSFCAALLSKSEAQRKQSKWWKWRRVYHHCVFISPPAAPSPSPPFYLPLSDASFHFASTLVSFWETGRNLFWAAKEEAALYRRFCCLHFIHPRQLNTAAANISGGDTFQERESETLSVTRLSLEAALFAFLSAHT